MLGATGERFLDKLEMTGKRRLELMAVPGESPLTEHQGRSSAFIRFFMRPPMFAKAGATLARDERFCIRVVRFNRPVI